ncbi:hypothetical protein FALCPG4_009498 [Fusarium falciforme]
MACVSVPCGPMTRVMCKICAGRESEGGQQQEERRSLEHRLDGILHISCPASAKALRIRQLLQDENSQTRLSEPSDAMGQGLPMNKSHLGIRHWTTLEAS